MNNKHTSGNWKLGNCSSVVTDTRREREHTKIDEDSIAFYGGELICESIENKADAQLIVAAPNLLEALENIQFDMIELQKRPNDTMIMGTILSVCQNAIKKAKGE